MYYYSPSKNSFFPVELKKDYILAECFPEDAIEVSDDVWEEFAGSLAPKGKQRVADENGLPTWRDIPPPTQEETVIASEKRRLF